MKVSKLPALGEHHCGFSVDPTSLVLLLRTLADQIESGTAFPQSVNQMTTNIMDDFESNTLTITYNDVTP